MDVKTAEELAGNCNPFLSPGAEIQAVRGQARIARETRKWPADAYLMFEDSSGISTPTSLVKLGNRCSIRLSYGDVVPGNEATFPPRVERVRTRPAAGGTRRSPTLFRVGQANSSTEEEVDNTPKNGSGSIAFTLP